MKVLLVALLCICTSVYCEASAEPSDQKSALRSKLRQYNASQVTTDVQAVLNSTNSLSTVGGVSASMLTINVQTTVKYTTPVLNVGSNSTALDGTTPPSRHELNSTTPISVNITSGTPVLNGTTTVGVKERFEFIDSNEDGFLTQPEYTDFVKTLDVDGDDRVSWSEFSSNQTLETRDFNLGTLVFQYLFFRADAETTGCLGTKEILNIFLLLDSDDDGRISKVEYVGGLSQLNNKLQQVKVTKAHVDIIFRAGDSDKDGRLSPIELNNVLMSADGDQDMKVSQIELVRMWTLNTGETEAQAKELFLFLDRNGDGFYEKFTDRMSVIRDLDQNGDSKIDEDEYESLFVRLAAKLDRDAARADAEDEFHIINLI